MLSLNNIEVAYDRVFLAVKSVSIDVPEGGLVALLGANGAGKSTTLKAISGLLRPERGEVTKGDITFAGKNLLALDPPDRVRLGLAHVLEGRRVFVHLTPRENLSGGDVDASRSRVISTGSSSAPSPGFRVSPSAPMRKPVICPAASSRCWPSAAR